MKGNRSKETASEGKHRSPVNPVSMTNSIGRAEPLNNKKVKVMVGCLSVTMPEIIWRYAP